MEEKLILAVSDGNKYGIYLDSQFAYHLSSQPKTLFVREHEKELIYMRLSK